jgi:hypothetical protein
VVPRDGVVVATSRIGYATAHTAEYSGAFAGIPRLVFSLRLLTFDALL